MRIAILAGLVASSFAAGVDAQQAVQWRVSDGGNGHWYAAISAPGIGWADASAAAVHRGGLLVTLTSPQENDFVVSSSQNASPRYPWIGLKQSPDAVEPLGGWAWVTGEPLGWSNWSPSEPNGDPGFDADQANIWLVSEPGRPLGTWNDWHTGGPDGFVIEWSADCNNDGIVDYGQCLDGTLPDYNGNNIPDCCEAAAPCVPNMIRNGSFEIGPMQPCGWICVAPGDNRLVGWEVVLNSVDRERTEPAGCNENWFASHGNYSVDMNGCSVGGVIRQLVPTVAGARYDLSFDLSLNPSNVAVGRLRASAGDTSLVFEYERRPTNPQPNEHRSMQFTALSAVTEVAFESLNREYPAQWNGPVIDSVRLVFVVPASPSCIDADIFRDFNVNGADLGILLSQWGPNTPLTRSDLNHDGVVDGLDLGIFLSFWGPCP